MIGTPVLLATTAMGTRFEIVLAGAGADRLQAIGEAAIEEIEEWHRRLSRFAPDSLVSHINRTGRDSPVRLDTATFDLLADACRVGHESGGAFDIAVGATMESMGLHPASPDRGPASAPRAAAAGHSGVELDRETMSVRLLGSASLDLGGIAKGHALDAAARILHAHGVASALLHGGTSTVLAVGAPPDRAGWRIALDPAGQPAIELCDAALSVSSASGRTLDAGSRRIGHILDPRDGRPVPLTRRVAVSGPSARLADAWSTALAVLGERPAGLGPEWTSIFF